ncbi:phage antirepressor Ant [Rhodococcus hoagii]|nr:phage antirepressor Ant [Prescottella equi]NKV87970.1 phage antirepressor Ant [Prescottella equi]
MAFPVEQASPFDGLRRLRSDGSEFWSARELMSPMGYSAWRNFLVPIERAMKSAENQGNDVTSNFVGSRKVSGLRGPAQEDFEFSRFAAYLVAMNGDPNKPEVAAAQAYFAVKTREAELVQAQIPQTYADALREAASNYERAIAAEAAAQEANQKVEELEPLAAEYERFLDADGTLSLGGVANMLGLGRTTLFRFLKAERVLQPDNRPYQQFAEWFLVRPFKYTDSHDLQQISFTSSLRPDALEPLHRLLVRRGRLTVDA